jgi:nicotinamidase-related amidase
VACTQTGAPMPIDLAALAAADHSAVVTMEMQRGVIGDLSKLRDLANEVAELGVIDRAAELLAAARRAGLRVVHCTAEFRPDLAGSAANAPLLAAMARLPGHLVEGTPAAEVVPELGPDAGDLIESRQHGVTPFGGTSLDVTLRNLGVSTVIVAGVSVNLGVLGLAIEAVNLGYRVVVATDAVCGFPRDYAEAVMQHSMALVATRATVAELITAWGETRGS